MSTDLIARLEAATAGDIELDAAIAELLGYQPDIDLDICIDGERQFDLPRYTTSLDAALSLLPEGFSWSGYFHPRRGETEPELRAFANAYSLDEKISRTPSGALNRKIINGPHEGEASTAPIAICIAALKARHASPKEP